MLESGPKCQSNNPQVRASQDFEGVFCSGFGFSASHYGMQDIGYLTWGDKVIASTTIRNVEERGASAVMFEDQRRPRKCGHFAGKEILPVADYLDKLKLVLSTRKSVFVIARTDATDPAEGIERAVAYADAGADGVMVEAIRDLRTLEELARRVRVPIMVNQLFGGKSPNWSLPEMENAGASIVIYSTPCLFAARDAIQRYLKALQAGEGRLPQDGTVSMDEARQILLESPEIT